MKASNDRVQGWYGLKEWLKPYVGEQGEMTAHLKIFKNCVNLIRTLPALQFDEKRPNDAAKKPHELTHAPDAIRYFVAGRPIPAKAARERGEKGSVQEDQGNQASIQNAGAYMVFAERL